MKRVPEANIYSVNGSIAPQLFQRINDNFIYFDKINQHEGRFCLYDGHKSEVLFEIGEAQVEISNRGELFVFRYNEETTATLYSSSGELIWEKSLQGIYFDIVRDTYGNFICLGNIDGKTVIKIINKIGVESGSISPQGLQFGSCIHVRGDDIFLGGFDENNCFKILSFNYIGYKSRELELDADATDRVITKVISSGNRLFLSITGKCDSLVVLDMISGDSNEIYINELDLRYLMDFNLDNEYIYLLDGKSIHSYSLSDIVLFSQGRHKRQNRKESSLFGYQYIMYSMGISDHMQRLWGYITAAILSAAVTFFCVSTELLSGLLLTLTFSICLFWIIQYTTAITANMINFMDKSTRIDKLLSIYSRDYKEDFYTFPLYTGLFAASFAGLLTLSEFSIIYITLSGGVCYLIFYYAEKTFRGRVKDQNSDVIIDLLQPEDDNFREYIQKSIEKFRKENCERIRVDITLQDSPKENIIEKWARSRRAIIREIDEATLQSNRITAVLDMSKRDIKYSRISIIMDYICFIKREVKIKEIEIAFKDDTR